MGRAEGRQEASLPWLDSDRRRCAEGVLERMGRRGGRRALSVFLFFLWEDLGCALATFAFRVCSSRVCIGVTFPPSITEPCREIRFTRNRWLHGSEALGGVRCEA